MKEPPFTQQLKRSLCSLLRACLLRIAIFCFMLASVWGIGLAYPKTAVGYASFHLGQLALGPKYLSFYHSSLRHTNNGYLPLTIERYLADKIRYNSSSHAAQKIVKAYQRQLFKASGLQLKLAMEQQSFPPSHEQHHPKLQKSAVLAYNSLD